MKKIKFNLIEWLRSLKNRRFKEERSIAVLVYDNGHLVYRGDRTIDPDADGAGKSLDLAILTTANTLTAQVVGDLRRDIKREARKVRRA